MRQLETSLGTGYAAAGCRSCGRVFTCVTAFDRHQKITRDGLVCLDPASLGLHRKKSGRWGWKGTDYSFVRSLQNAEAGKISDRFSTPLVSSGGVA